LHIEHRTLNIEQAPPFTARVLALVRRIPPGRVATYGDIAAAAGHPRAARAVGNIMRGCSIRGVPCHRVVAAAGRLGGYGGYIGLKRDLLRAEGVRVVGSSIRDFRTRRFPLRGAPAAAPSRTPGALRPPANRLDASRGNIKAANCVKS
jgi:O-6-methylguanine DNA methyltransferase